MENDWMDDAWVFGAVLFVLGSIIGSFLNVCIHRIPQRQSLITPPSSCHCGERIPWRFNLPCVSWLLLRGKAACCQRSIPFRYFAVEVLAGALFAYAGLHFEDKDPYALFVSANLFFACILVCATFIDLEHMIIPDRLSVGGAVVGVALAFSFPVLWGWSGDGLVPRMAGGTEALLGLLVGSGILYWVGVFAETLLRREAIGQGDVKLLGCVGAFCGWEGALFSIFGGALVGTMLLLPITMLASGSKRGAPDGEAQSEKIGWGVEVPFGPFLALAALLYQFGLNEFVDAYFQQFAAILQIAWQDSPVFHPW